MNPTEAAKVLAKAAAYDNRQATQAAALAWAEALDPDLPLQDALRIVGEHYRDERAWVMPADINRRWRSLGKARLETAVRMGLPAPPDELADNPGDWHAIQRTPHQRRELPSQPPPPEWQAMLDAATPRKAV